MPASSRLCGRSGDPAWRFERCPFGIGQYPRASGQSADEEAATIVIAASNHVECPAELHANRRRILLALYVFFRARGRAN